MQLSKFNVEAEHVPEKQLVVADTLSRRPQRDVSDEATDQVVQTHAESIVVNAPVSSQRLCKIRVATQHNDELQQITSFIRNGWSPKTMLSHLCTVIILQEHISWKQMDWCYIRTGWSSLLHRGVVRSPGTNMVPGTCQDGSVVAEHQCWD